MFAVLVVVGIVALPTIGAGEFVQAIEVPLGSPAVVRAYKISKRFDCDISAVCAGLALELGEDGKARALMSEPRSGSCLRLAKLNYHQCLASAGPHYEDIYCLGQHPMMDPGQCVVDATHAPEFTMIEAYEAYGDYTTIGNLTRDLILRAARA